MSFAVLRIVSSSLRSCFQAIRSVGNDNIDDNEFFHVFMIVLNAALIDFRTYKCEESFSFYLKKKNVQQIIARDAPELQKPV